MTTPAEPLVIPDDIEAQLYAFMRQGSVCFMTTVTSAGEPSVRQVSTFVEDGFTCSTISQSDSPKLRHLERNPGISLLFVKQGEGFRARQVTLQGRAEILKNDLDAINAMNERRSAFYGRAIPMPHNPAPRSLIVIRPTLLRAEGFIGDGPAVVVAREFSPLVASIPNAWG